MQKDTMSYISVYTCSYTGNSSNIYSRDLGVRLVNTNFRVGQ